MNTPVGEYGVAKEDGLEGDRRAPTHPNEGERGKSLFAELEQGISHLSPDHCAGLLGELEKLKGKAWITMMRFQGAAVPSAVIEKDRYLSVDEVAERFHVSKKWLYRNKKKMPHSQPSRKILLFPERAITKWFASRN